MNLNKIQYFLSAVEEQSFTKAARKNYVTQVAVTQQIAAMEKEMDTELFERSGNRIRVTQAGQFLYQEMKKIMAQYQVTLEQLQEYKEDSRRELRIGIGMLSDYEWILPHLNQFQQSHPQMEYTFVTGDYEELLEKMETGKLSMMFSGGLYRSDREQLKMLPAYETKISLVVNDKSPLYEKEELSFGDLKDVPLILIGSGEYERNRSYQDFYQICRDTGFIPKVVCHAADSVEAMIKVDMGIGCVLYMEEAAGFLSAHPRRKILTVSGPVKVQKYLIYRRAVHNPLMDEFIAMLERETGMGYAASRAELNVDFEQLWKEALKQEDGTYSRRMSDDKVEKEFWRQFMKKKTGYHPDSWAGAMVEQVKSLMEPYQVHTIMEIGPGWGNFTMALADCCDTLTCVDISEDVLSYIQETARQLEKKNIFSICSKWEDMTDVCQADVVFGYNCFYRMLELKECLAIMNRAAGKLCIMGMSVEGMTPYDRALKEAFGVKILCDKKDYIHFVNVLYQMGIDASVKVVPLTKELIFASREEMIRRVLSRVKDGQQLWETRSQQVDEILNRYFKQAPDGSWRYRLHYRGTLVYWEPVNTEKLCL